MRILLCLIYCALLTADLHAQLPQRPAPMQHPIAPTYSPPPQYPTTGPTRPAPAGEGWQWAEEKGERGGYWWRWKQAPQTPKEPTRTEGCPGDSCPCGCNEGGPCVCGESEHYVCLGGRLAARRQARQEARALSYGYALPASYTSAGSVFYGSGGFAPSSYPVASYGYSNYVEPMTFSLPYSWAQFSQPQFSNYGAFSTYPTGFGVQSRQSFRLTSSANCGPGG